MIKTQVATINKKTLTYHQCVSIDEQKDLPKGITGYWEYEGRKIFAPGEVVKLVTQNVQNSELTAFNNPKVVQDHYKKLREHQQKQIIDHYDKMIADIRANPNYPSDAKEHTIKQIEDNKRNIASMYPDADGIFRPDKNTAEKLLGQDVINNLTEYQKKEIFG